MLVLLSCARCLSPCWPAKTTTAAARSTRPSPTPARPASPDTTIRRRPRADGPRPTRPTPPTDGARPDGPWPTPPALTEQQQRGKYLVENVIACPECHTPRLPNGQLDMSKYMAGDTACFAKLPNNDCIYARNLTPHATGLGNRTDADIKKMFMEGLRPAADRRSGPAPDHALLRVRQHGPRGRRRHRGLPEDAAAGGTTRSRSRARRSTWPSRRRPSTLAAVPTPADDYDNPGGRAARALPGDPDRGCAWSATRPHLMGGETALDETKFFQGGEEFPIPIGRR